jgi:hypothetical protein
MAEPGLREAEEAAARPYRPNSEESNELYEPGLAEAESGWNEGMSDADQQLFGPKGWDAPPPDEFDPRMMGGDYDFDFQNDPARGGYEDGSNEWMAGAGGGQKRYGDAWDPGVDDLEGGPYKGDNPEPPDPDSWENNPPGMGRQGNMDSELWQDPEEGSWPSMPESDVDLDAGRVPQDEPYDTAGYRRSPGSGGEGENVEWDYEPEKRAPLQKELPFEPAQDHEAEWARQADQEQGQLDLEKGMGDDDWRSPPDYEDRRNAVTRPNENAREGLDLSTMPPEVVQWVQGLPPEIQAAVAQALLRAKPEVQSSIFRDRAARGPL